MRINFRVTVGCKKAHEAPKNPRMYHENRHCVGRFNRYERYNSNWTHRWPILLHLNYKFYTESFFFTSVIVTWTLNIIQIYPLFLLNCNIVASIENTLLDFQVVIFFGIYIEQTVNFKITSQLVVGRLNIWVSCNVGFTSLNWLASFSIYLFLSVFFHYILHNNPESEHSSLFLCKFILKSFFLRDFSFLNCFTECGNESAKNIA